MAERPEGIGGVVRVVPPFVTDDRGSFAKPFSRRLLRDAGVDFGVAEVFWSSSATGVVRGLHFQYPPAAMAKLVFVTTGRVRDVVLDLRADSETHGRHEVFDLDPSGGALVVPVGCAHGFEVVAGPAVMCYLQDGPYDQATDAGVRWDSAGVAWRTQRPVVSPRDAALPVLAEVPRLTTAEWNRRDG